MLIRRLTRSFRARLPDGAISAVRSLAIGWGKLTAALRMVSRSIVAPPVPIAATERYIAILLTTGSCRTKAITVEDDLPDSCYRRIFVGVWLSASATRRSLAAFALGSAHARSQRGGAPTCIVTFGSWMRAGLRKNAG